MESQLKSNKKAGLYLDGTWVSNIYPYDAKGRPLVGVQLFNQVGKPINVITQMWPAFQIRPLVLETNFQNPILAPFAWLLRAIKVPALVSASAEERRQTEQAFANVVDALKSGRRPYTG